MNIDQWMNEKKMQIPKWVDQCNKSCNNWFSFVNSNMIVCMSAFDRMLSNYIFMAAIEMTNQMVKTIYKNEIIFHSYITVNAILRFILLSEGKEYYCDFTWYFSTLKRNELIKKKKWVYFVKKDERIEICWFFFRTATTSCIQKEKRNHKMIERIWRLLIEFSIEAHYTNKRLIFPSLVAMRKKTMGISFVTFSWILFEFSTLKMCGSIEID